eukprot:4414613-Prymnesium_polylepis.1
MLGHRAPVDLYLSAGRAAASSSAQIKSSVSRSHTRAPVQGHVAQSFVVDPETGRTVALEEMQKRPQDIYVEVLKKTLDLHPLSSTAARGPANSLRGTPRQLLPATARPGTASSSGAK